MAKADWRGPYFSGDDTPLRYLGHGSTNVAAGGEPRCKRATGYAWGPYSWFGYTYDGPDIGDFPLVNGSISAALRTANDSWGVYTSGPFGLVLRQQTLLSLDPASPSHWSNASMYMVGLDYGVATESSSTRCHLYKTIGGSTWSLGSNFYPDIISESFIQLEVKAENSGPNVVLSRRHNKGTELTNPGDGVWSNWSIITTDTTPGVLINGGYWGFGNGLTGGGFSSSAGGNQYIDRVQIVKGIV